MSFTRFIREARASKTGTRKANNTACTPEEYAFTAAPFSVRISASRTVFSR